MILEQVDHRPLIRARSVYRDFGQTFLYGNPGALRTIIFYF